jgi:hypothetical protein
MAGRIGIVLGLIGTGAVFTLMGSGQTGLGFAAVGVVYLTWEVARLWRPPAQGIEKERRSSS